MSARERIQKKITYRLDELEDCMYKGKLEEAGAILPTITKYWPIMDDEEKDFVQACQWSIEEGKSWEPYNK